MNDKQICENCFYCVRRSDGCWECRKRAPIAGGYAPEGFRIQGQFAIVNWCDWCGEYKPKQDDGVPA